MSQEAALFCEGGFVSLPGKVQRVEVDGKAVYQAPGAEPTRSKEGRVPKAVVTLVVTSPRRDYTEIALIQEAFRPTDAQGVRASEPERYQLVSDRLERTLADLLFERLVTRTDPRTGRTVCELSFCDYNLIREA